MLTAPHGSSGPLEPVETFTHPHVRYELYEHPDRGAAEHFLIGYRHERAYLVERGSRALCHSTATGLIWFGGFPLIERARHIPGALHRALSAPTAQAAKAA